MADAPAHPEIDRYMAILNKLQNALWRVRPPREVDDAEIDQIMAEADAWIVDMRPIWRQPADQIVLIEKSMHIVLKSMIDQRKSENQSNES